MSNTDISLGTWLSLYSEAIAEVLVNAGYEWVTVDLEHSAITIDQAEKLIRVIDLAGAKPYVRVSSNDEVQIKRVLDAGAKGIIVPMVESKEDVLAAINATNYPPKGTRGMGLARAQGYGEAKAKNDYKLNKLFAGIAEGNIGSIKVLEKNGFSLEGTRINHLYYGGKYYNKINYGLLLSK